MRISRREAGEIRVRTVIEVSLVLIVAYMVFQIAPVVAMRINFLNQLEVIANSPIQDTGAELRQQVFDSARDRGLVLRREHIFVQRDRELRKTIIDTTYQLEVPLLFGKSYRWTVKDHVEALLL